jgi:hypothetical protein
MNRRVQPHESSGVTVYFSVPLPPWPAIWPLLVAAIDPGLPGPSGNEIT